MKPEGDPKIPSDLTKQRFEFYVYHPGVPGTRGCGVPSRWCCAGSWAIGWTRLKELEPKRCWSPDPWHKGELRTGLGDRSEAGPWMFFVDKD